VFKSSEARFYLPFFFDCGRSPNYERLTPLPYAARCGCPSLKAGGRSFSSVLKLDFGRGCPMFVPHGRTWGFSGGPFVEKWWHCFSPLALLHPRELSALFAASESHPKPNPPAKKVYRRNPLQSANFMVILLCRGLRGSQRPIPSAERPRTGSLPLPVGTVAWLARRISWLGLARGKEARIEGEARNDGTERRTAQPG
jgi:hypothetical protein